MGRSRIMADDTSHRREFKDRLLNRIIASSVPPVVEKIEKMVLLLPHNYQNMGEAELQNKLVYTVELSHSPETALQTLDILFGRITQPNHIEFQLVYLAKDQEPKVDFTTVTVEKPVEVQTAREIMKRRQFKADLSDKISSFRADSDTDAVETRIKVRVPVNFKSMSSDNLYQSIVTLNLLTPEQAQDLFASLGGRKVNTKFDIAWESEASPSVVKTASKTIQVTVPIQFRDMKVTDQYVHLVRTLELLPGEANDVIDILKGKPPISSTIFNIIEEG